MPISTSQQLCVALNRDLNRTGSKASSAKTTNDVVREKFTVNKEGTLFEFAHKQPDTDFWNGFRYYSGGKRTKIRFRRTNSGPA